jgi:hypothetical protein
MVVARAIGSLSQQLDETFRAVDALQRAAGDAPPAPKIVLPRIVAESADTIQGWLADGHEAADRAERAARPGAVDLDALRAALANSTTPSWTRSSPAGRTCPSGRRPQRRLTQPSKRWEGRQDE